MELRARATARTKRSSTGRGVGGRCTRSRVGPSEPRRGHESGDSDVEGISHPCDIQHAHVPLPAFDLTHVGAVDTCRVGKRLLRKGTLQSAGADGFAQLAQFSIYIRVDRLAWHAFSVAPRSLTSHGIYDPCLRRSCTPLGNVQFRECLLNCEIVDAGQGEINPIADRAGPVMHGMRRLRTPECTRAERCRGRHACCTRSPCCFAGGP